MAKQNPIVTAGLRLLRDIVRKSLRNAGRKSKPATFRDQPKPKPRDRRQQTNVLTADTYPGDFTGRPNIVYTPIKDGLPDPGEIVWTWVPYEDDHSQGKDRPALIIARDGRWLLGLQVSSQDRDFSYEESQGRYWMDIGPGPWDGKGRDSEVRLNRIIRLEPDKVRRIGAIVEPELFNNVARGVLKHY